MSSVVLQYASVYCIWRVIHMYWMAAIGGAWHRMLCGGLPDGDRKSTHSHSPTGKPLVAKITPRP